MAKPVRADAEWQDATVQRLRNLPRGGLAKLSKAIGVHLQSISKWKTRERPVAPEHRAQIDLFLSDR